MGCDCTAYVETQDAAGGWNFAGPHDMDGEPAPWYVPRNYQLFGLLAGVRDKSVEPISPPRGLPDDVSTEVWAAHLEEDEQSHSTSWLTMSELSRCAAIDPDFLFSFDELGAKHRVRIVFWFVS